MKKFIFLGLSLIYFISCSNQQNTNVEDVPLQNIDLVFEGTIGEKYKIVMQIEAFKGEVKGKYFYQNVGNDMQLKGTINSNDEIELQEFNNKGSITGIFKGKLVGLYNIDDILQKPTLTGKWEKPDGSKSLPFELTETSKGYEECKPKKNSLKNISGEYTKETDEETGTLTIKYVNETEFKFNISVASESCTGSFPDYDELKIAKISNNKGVYEEDGVRFQFTFNLDTKMITVEENEEASEFHGVQCSFSGTYKKD